jgi:hypothetical protein
MDGESSGESAEVDVDKDAEE